MLVGWYLRRAIPWMALLGCCAGALLLAAAVDRWPSTALVLLPALVAACAAAAAFCFDEAALEVVAVTPRGATWRRASRIGVALVPLSVWTVAVLLGLRNLPLSRGSWWLIGFAATGLTVGLAALASRRAVSTPGGSLAAAVVMAAISPVVVTAFLGWESPYPLGSFPSSALTLWLALAVAGVLACAVALRPGVRR
jgi:hypothetical protein